LQKLAAPGVGEHFCQELLNHCQDLPSAFMLEFQEKLSIKLEELS